MILVYTQQDQRIVAQPWILGQTIPSPVIWIDLHHPTREEELAVEQFIGMEIPTREEMQEIEISDRLYQEKDALVMTTTVVKADLPEPESHDITFVLCRHILITIRYVDIVPFQRFALAIDKLPAAKQDGVNIFLSLLDYTVDRVADILEHIGRDTDALTQDIFRRTGRQNVDSFQRILERIGDGGNLVSKVHESLVTLGRMAGFVSHHSLLSEAANEQRLAAARRDIVGLNEHTSYLTGKFNFLLDATLGMINIEQNAIIKIFSVATIIFLPPTLIAGVFGMNFKFMPELEMPSGYPMALGLMALSAVLPLAYFKLRKWL